MFIGSVTASVEKQKVLDTINTRKTAKLQETQQS